MVTSDPASVYVVSLTARNRTGSEGERQGAWSVDLAGGPRDRLRVRERERRDPVQEALERGAQFHPGQVRAQAAVDADAEGNVPVALAVEQHLIGAVEHRRVPVGG